MGRRKGELALREDNAGLQAANLNHALRKIKISEWVEVVLVVIEQAKAGKKWACELALEYGFAPAGVTLKIDANVNLHDDREIFTPEQRLAMAREYIKNDAAIIDAEVISDAE